MLKDRMGRAMREIVGLTFLIYKDREGGTPLWMETQNVRPETDGNYFAILGATKDLPLDLFASGEPRWVGVQINLPGEEEQPRVQLVSVPFALKAADAETLGGKPLSAFVLTPEAAKSAVAAGLQTGGQAITTVLPTAAATTTNFLAKFLDGTGTLGDSALFQSGTNVGVNNTAPITTLDVTGTIRAVNHQNAPYGTYLMPNGGAANSFRFGFGNNLYFDGANWRTKGDGANNSGSAMLTDMGTGQLSIFTLPSTGAADQVVSNAGFNAFEKMRIDGAGNVGIGTPSPGSKLHVLGGRTEFGSAAQDYLPTAGNWNYTLLLDALDTSSIGFHDSGASVASIRYNNSGFTIGGDDGWGAKNVMMPGNVGIGIANPIQKLEVAGGIKFTSGVLTFPDGTTQTSACGILFSANGRAGRPDSVTPAGGGAMSECSAAASLQQVVQEQRAQIQRLQTEVESLKQRLDALVGARQ